MFVFVAAPQPLKISLITRALLIIHHFTRISKEKNVDKINIVTVFKRETIGVENDSNPIVINLILSLI